MNRETFSFKVSIILCSVLLCNIASQAKESGLLNNINTDCPRLQILLDRQWRFYRGDVQNSQSRTFDDSMWRQVDLPHDWSIEDIPGTDSPNTPDAVGAINTGYFVGGTGWYRKVFTIPSELQGKRFHLQFDGVYMNAYIWLNGKRLGNHPYGYTSFWFDITDELEIGKQNVLAVKVNNEGRNSRWYSGSGIYRHVWLKVLDPVHVTQWGTYITTPQVTSSSATVNVKTTVLNETKESKSITVITYIYDDKETELERIGSAKQKQLAPNIPFEFSQDLGVSNPKLWSPESPALYNCVTEIYQEQSLTDRVKTVFGIRTIEFSVEKGFLLNGKSTLMRGGCMHHDNGPLGSAAYDRAEQRRVELMKASGFNAIRCAHNPPSKAYLDACDNLGMLVIDEAFDMWRKPKNPQDYHLYFNDWWEKDVESMVMRDRNHPSIIMWSTGNEIPERAAPEGVATSKMLAEYIRKLEPTRPVTSAVNGLNPDKDPYFATLDIAGYNYSFGGDHGKETIFELDHKRVPDRIMYCSESYPLEAFGAWMDVINHPYVIGDFVWTSFDYLGESSIGWRGYLHEGSFYPWTHAFCGDIDICGFKRPQSYYRDVLWNTGQKVSLFVTSPEPSFEPNPKRMDWSKWHWHDVTACWNWPDMEDKEIEVVVYSSCEEVELFLNDKSLGKKPANLKTKLTAKWQVHYQPGVLKAVGFNDSKEVYSSALKTAEKPVQIKLTADRSSIKADGQDLSYITVELLDANGVRHPKAENLIKFEIEGSGTILSVGSSNPISTESYKLHKRKAYQGRCLVIVKSSVEPGKIKLKASSDGLKSGMLAISSL